MVGGLKTLGVVVLIVLAAALGTGCGDDDDPTLTTTTPDLGASGPTGASGATGASGEEGDTGPPIDLETARTNLEDAGFTVEDQSGGDDLAQETADGTIEAEEGIRVFQPGDPADVVIQQFASSEDAEAVADSLETGFFAVEIRDDVVLFAVKDQGTLLEEVASAAAGE